MATITQEQFEAAFKIRQEKVIWDSDMRSLETEYAVKKRFLEQRLHKLQKDCPHPFGKRATAECERICDICGGEC